MEKILLVGMDNPQWTPGSIEMYHDPHGCAGDGALWPDPPGCAGDRLMRMAMLRTGISRDQWLLGTERVNLCPAVWEPSMGVRRAFELEPQIRHRTVVMLGKSVLHSFSRALYEQGERTIHLLPPMRWTKDRDWTYVPHPSGRNLWYNEPVQREAVAIFLADLLEQCGIWDGVDRSEREPEPEPEDPEVELDPDESLCPEEIL